MKRIFIGVVLAVMVITTWCPFTEASSNPTVYLDGGKLNFDVPPQIVNGRTLVPMRAIFEALGASISWNNTTKTVQGSKDSIKLKMTINSNSYYINNEAKTSDVAPMIQNGRTLVPLRIIAESLQCKVDYKGSTNVVTIESGASTSSVITNNYRDEDLTPVWGGNKYGYEDQNGNMVIKPRFDWADDFSEGLAVVEVADGNYGYIDTNGEMVLAAKYDVALPFIDGKAQVLEGENRVYIDKEGQVINEDVIDGFKLVDFQITDKKPFENGEYDYSFYITLENTGNSTWDRSNGTGYSFLWHWEDSGIDFGHFKKVLPGETFTEVSTVISKPGERCYITVDTPGGDCGRLIEYITE